jgi:hypothetical protein
MKTRRHDKHYFANTGELQYHSHKQEINRKNLNKEVKMRMHDEQHFANTGE